MSDIAAVYISVLKNGIKKNLPKEVIPAAVGAGLPKTSLPSLFGAIARGDPSAFASVAGATPTVLIAVEKAIKSAYADSFKTVFLVSIAFASICSISSLFIKDFGTKNTENHIDLKASVAERAIKDETR